MAKFNPYITLDGSVGLYNDDFEDIYHSVDGALTEAYEKFVYPIDYNSLVENKTIKVLDICYGIGYNSKSFLNFLLEKKFFSKKNSKIFSTNSSNIDTIHTDKNSQRDLYNNTDTIYTNNANQRIYIKAVDNDEILFLLSPFIKTGIPVRNDEKLAQIYKNVSKNIKRPQKIKIKKIINFLIFEKICQKCPNIVNNKDFENILYDIKYNYIFDSFIKGYFRYYKNSLLSYSSKPSVCSFLHNIYYKYMSIWYKWRMKIYKLRYINFEPCIGDARDVIKNDTNLYNLIFLDAFTPSKCPCLWSFEFMKLLYEHLDENGLLMTYSSAAPVRSAMKSAGFYIGYIYNKRLDRYVGTIASKNKDKIRYPISEADLGLLNTKAGIFYRDKNLTGQNEAIIEARNIELKSSEKMSSTFYKKHLSS